MTDQPESPRQAVRQQLSGAAERVAPRLLGATLVSDIGGERVTMRITEVEAYAGSDDPASHAFRGPTPRTQVMFGPAGHLYCYFVYGMHWCANITCGPDGQAAAVLLRAATVIVGLDTARRRGGARLPDKNLATGPARLARSLGLDGGLTGLDVLSDKSIVRLTGLGSAAAAGASGNGVGYRTGPRVGVSAAADVAWRFWLDEPSVSAYRAAASRARPGRPGRPGRLYDHEHFPRPP